MRALGACCKSGGPWRKVLFAYASKRGSTAEIAEAIAAVLRRPGDEVDRVEAGAVAELDG